MRRIITILLLITIVGTTAWSLWRWRTPTTAPTDPWRCMPPHVAAVIDVPEVLRAWDGFAHTSQLYGITERLPVMACAGRMVQRAMELREARPDLSAALNGLHALIGVLREGSEGAGALIALGPMDTDLLPVLSSTIGMDAAAIRTLAQGATVELRPDSLVGPLTCRKVDDLLLLASSAGVMDEAMLQWQQPSLAVQDPLFARALKTLGAGAEAHVLVHTGRMHNLLHNWWLPGTLARLEAPPGWVALDLRTRPDALFLSGLLVPAESGPWVERIQGQGIGRIGIARVLPASVGAFDLFHLAEPHNWIAHDSVAPEVADALLGWVHGMVGTAREPGDTIVPGGRWAAFRTDDPSGAQEQLDGHCPGCARDSALFRGVRMAVLPAGGAYERLLGPAFAPFQRPWYAVLGDVVVMSPERRDLERSIEAWHDGNTLAEDKRTNSWLQRISESSGRLAWCDMGRAHTILTSGLRDPERRPSVGDRPLREGLGGLTLQVSPGQHGMLHVMIGLQYAPLEQRATPQLLWSCAAGQGIARKPDIVLNHTNGTREVVVQDAGHAIHLVGSTGKVLWSRTLDGPIKGPVAQVDRFKNGKLQLMLGTSTTLYQIDRNGKDVGGFPVKLPTMASAPMAVLDYDDTRDYRILVPLIDGTIRNYGIDGAPVAGWEAKKLDLTTTNAVHHLRIRNKDYLLVVDGQGQVLLLDRRGLEREQTPLSLGRNPGLQQVVPGLDLQSTRLYWTDTTATVYEGRLDGTRTTMLAGRPEVAWAADVDRDGTMDLVRTNRDSLVLISAGRTQFARAFGDTVLRELSLYTLDGHWIGVVRPATAQVTLVDGSGRDMPGMPLEGTVPMSIADLNLDGKLEVVTVARDGRVVAYHLP